jgi:uncharacterized protein YjbI with pentapeptide repeats
VVVNSEISEQTHYADRTFEGVRLERADLVRSEFYDCSFTRCSFAGTTFRRCRFVNCVFEHCDWSLVQVVGSTFSGVRFEESKAIGMDWTQADWSATRLGDPIGFTKSIVSHSTFIGLRLHGLQMRDCIAVDVDFREADLSHADFRGSDLAESLFGSTNLTEANLTGARNYDIAPGQNILKQARFSLPEAMSLLFSLDIVLVEEGD